ncbi:MAG: hypothetical protein KJO90_03905 [Eudoraea sp.]|nr:hypothetical protein [Eudoraea sp.]
MNKIVKIVLAVIGVLAAIMWYQLPSRDVPVSEAIENGAMNTMFMLMYLLLGVAVAASVLFAIRAYFSNPKSLKKTLMLIAGFAVVVVIAYALSDGDDGTVEAMSGRGVETTTDVVKNIGTGLNVFFFLVIIAVGSMAWGGIKKVISK